VLVSDLAAALAAALAAVSSSLYCSSILGSTPFLKAFA